METLRFTGGLDGTEVHHHRVLEGEHVWFDDIRVGEVDANGLLWNFVSRFGRDGAL